MSFLYPSFLWAFLALAIPIIIHLFNFRRYKKVYFTNVRFLRQLKQESESKSKLKQYLILLSRLMAISALVLAFAQPVWNNNSQKVRTGKKAISIYIDNSFSMEAVNQSGFLLGMAKDRARELANCFSASDVFQLLTNDFEGRHQRFVSREEFFQSVQEVKLSPAFRDLSAVYSRQRDGLLKCDAEDKRSYILSDFQKTFIDKVTSFSPDTFFSNNWIPLIENSPRGNNIFLDSCWFENPIQQKGVVQRLHVRLMNSSSQDLENAAARLYLNGKMVAPLSFSTDAGNQEELIFSFVVKENGLQNGYIEIDDHPVTYDDRLYFSFQVKERYSVLLIHGNEGKSNDAFLSLLSADSIFQFVPMNESAINFTSFTAQDIIVLNGLKKISDGTAKELKKFVEQGGSLSIFPSVDPDIASYNEMLRSFQMNMMGVVDTTNHAMQKLNFVQGFFSGVFEKNDENMDLPRVFNHYRLTRSTTTSEEVILRLMNDMPFLSSYSFGKGKIYFCSSSLEEQWTNFIRHALFVPTIYKMVFNSQIPYPHYYKTSTNAVAELRQTGTSNEATFSVSSLDSSFEFIPEKRVMDNKTLLFMQGMVNKAGNFFLSNQYNKLLSLSFNYPREESVLEYYDASSLRDLMKEKHWNGINILESASKGIKASMEDAESGAKLWKLFLILTLLFFTLEVALIRLLK